MGSPAGDVWVFVETLTGAAAGSGATSAAAGSGATSDATSSGARTISAAASDAHAASGGRHVRMRDGGARAAGPRAAEVSLELLGQARVLADRLGTRTGAVCAGGEPARALAPALVAAGADTVYLAVDDSLVDYLAQPYARVVTEAVRHFQPQIVLYGATTTGRDLAPRVASALRTGLTADCTDLDVGDHEIKGLAYRDLLYQIRPAFGGNIIATIVSPEHRPQMATVREGVLRLPKPDPSRRGDVVELDVERVGGPPGGHNGRPTAAGGPHPARRPGLRGDPRAKGARGEIGRLEGRPGGRRRRRGRGLGRRLQAAGRSGRHAGRRRGRLARRGRRRLDRPRAPGRPDGHHRASKALHRGRHLGLGAAPRRHGPVGPHPRHQHRSAGADLLGRPLRHRRRSPQRDAQADAYREKR